MLNANIYQTRVEDYQAVTSEPDPTSSDGLQLACSATFPEMRARGMELDARVQRDDRACGSIWAAAYNDAVYTDWSNATCPRS